MSHNSNILRLADARRSLRTPGLILLMVNNSRGKDRADLAVSIKIPCDERGVQVKGTLDVATLATDVGMFVDTAIENHVRLWNKVISKTWEPLIVVGYDPVHFVRYALFRVPRPDEVSERAFNTTVLESIRDAGMRFNMMTLACYES